MKIYTINDDLELSDGFDVFKNDETNHIYTEMEQKLLQFGVIVDNFDIVKIESTTNKEMMIATNCTYMDMERKLIARVVGSFCLQLPTVLCLRPLDFFAIWHDDRFHMCHYNRRGGVILEKQYSPSKLLQVETANGNMFAFNLNEANVVRGLEIRRARI